MGSATEKGGLAGSACQHVGIVLMSFIYWSNGNPSLGDGWLKTIPLISSSARSLFLHDLSPLNGGHVPTKYSDFNRAAKLTF